MWGNAAGSSGVEMDVSLALCPRNERGSTEGLYLTEAALFSSLLCCELLLHRSSVECTLLTMVRTKESQVRNSLCASLATLKWWDPDRNKKGPWSATR